MIFPDTVIWALHIQPNDERGIVQDIILTPASQGAWSTASGDTPASHGVLPLVELNSWELTRDGFEIDNGAIRPGGLVNYTWGTLGLTNSPDVVHGNKPFDPYVDWDWSGAAWSWHYASPVWDAGAQNWMPPTFATFTKYASGKINGQPEIRGDRVGITLNSQSDGLKDIPISPVVLMGLGGAIVIPADDSTSLDRVTHADMIDTGDWTIQYRIKVTIGNTSQHTSVDSDQFLIRLLSLGGGLQSMRFQVKQISGANKLVLSHDSSSVTPVWFTVTILWNSINKTIDGWVDDTQTVFDDTINEPSLSITPVTTRFRNVSNQHATKFAFFRRWNRILTKGELLARWNRPIVASDEESLVWDFEFQTGHGSIVYDSTENQHGDLVGFGGLVDDQWEPTDTGDAAFAGSRPGVMVGDQFGIKAQDNMTALRSYIAGLSASGSDAQTLLLNGEILPNDFSHASSVTLSVTHSKIADGGQERTEWAPKQLLDITPQGLQSGTVFTVVSTSHTPFDTSISVNKNLFVEETLIAETDAKTIATTDATEVWQGRKVASDVTNLELIIAEILPKVVRGDAGASSPPGPGQLRISTKDISGFQLTQRLIQQFGPRAGTVILTNMPGVALDDALYAPGSMSSHEAVNRAASAQQSADDWPSFFQEDEIEGQWNQQGWPNLWEATAGETITELEIINSSLDRLKRTRHTAVIVLCQRTVDPIAVGDVSADAHLNEAYATASSRDFNRIKAGLGTPEMIWETGLRNTSSAHDFAENLLVIQGGFIVSVARRATTVTRELASIPGKTVNVIDTRLPLIATAKNAMVLRSVTNLNDLGQPVMTLTVWLAPGASHWLAPSGVDWTAPSNVPWETPGG